VPETAALINPYIGPAAFTEEESGCFFGRLAESRELASLVIARRAVLLYAESGSGKTSLLQASLVPELKRRKRIRTFPIARVLGSLETSGNIYVENALASLFPAAPDSLHGRTFTQAFEPALARGDSGRQPQTSLVIFDQFEEIFTVHPELTGQREDFFGQLNECLAKYPQFSVLLSMREDYLADLDAYAASLPDRLRSRMRLERLGVASALEAIREPAARAGMPFAPNAAEGLVDNLRRIRTRATSFALGQHVEPVQLQIVCRQLWQHLTEDESRQNSDISVNDVKAYADVDDALIHFYRDSLAKAQQAAVTERALRRWFDDRLITPAGTRGLVYRGDRETEGLPNAAVDILQDCYVIRADVRGGNVWYELAHDRLVEPVQQDNLAWKAIHPNPIAQALERGPDRLLKGRELEDAIFYARENSKDLSNEEQRLLRRSREAESRKHKLRWITFLAVAVVGAVLFILTVRARSAEADAKTQLIEANKQKTEAEKQKTEAEKQKTEAEKQKTEAEKQKVEADKQKGKAESAAAAAALAERASVAANSDLHEVMRLTLNTGEVGRTQLNLLLSVHAASVNLGLEKNELPAIDLLRQQFHVTGGRPLIGHNSETRVAAFSNDHRWLATASSDGEMRLWDLDDSNVGEHSVHIGAHNGAVNALAFSPDGKWLISGGDDGAVGLWELKNGGVRAAGLSRPGYGNIYSLAVSPNGRWVVFGTQKGNACIWPLSADGLITAPCEVGKLNNKDPKQNSVTKVLFSSKGRWLATAHIAHIASKEDEAWNAGIDLWDVSNDDFPKQEPRMLFHFRRPDLNNEETLQAFAFSPDEDLLAVAYGYNAQVWDLRDKQPPSKIFDSPDNLINATERGWIKSVAITPDDRWLATSGGKLWDLKSPAAAPRVLEGPLSLVTLSDDGRWLAMAGDDSIHLYDLRDLSRSSVTFRGQDSAANHILFSPGDNPEYLLALGDFNARLWTVADPRVDPVSIKAPTGAIRSFAVSPDEKWIATSGDEEHKVIVRSLLSPRRVVQQIPMSSSSEVAISGNGQWMAAMEQANARVRLWSFPDLTPRSLQPADGGATFSYPGVAFSPDNRWLVRGTSTPEGITIWDLSNPSAIPRFCRAPGGAVRALAFSPDGRYLVAGTRKSQADLWDLKDPIELCASESQIGQHSDSVARIAISPDSRLLATASFDGHGRLWDIDTCRQIKACKPLADLPFQIGQRVTQVAFSPDGHSVAFGSWDYTIQLVNLNGRQASKPLLFAGQNGRISAISFSTDSKWLITAAEDQTIRIWDRADPHQTPVILRSDGRVFSLAVSKDGRKLISASDDGTLGIWRLQYADLVEAACQTAGRQLTKAEVEQFLGDDDAHHELPCASQPKTR
jgi:WD40 repeat protein